MKKVVIARAWALGLLGLLILTLDQVSKDWALHHVPFLHSLLAYPFGGIPIVDGSPVFSVSINVLSNTGSAWGWFHQWPRALLAVRIAALTIMLGFLVTGRIRKEWRFPLVLVVAGAAGNILDVLRYGAVIDFIHVRFGNWSFPLFNVADAAICMGVALVFLISWRERRTAA